MRGIILEVGVDGSFLVCSCGKRSGGVRGRPEEYQAFVAEHKGHGSGEVQERCSEEWLKLFRRRGYGT